jgi:AcrR family transcriptional regulator
VDHVGNIGALTTLSPIVPQRLREVRRRLRVVRHVPGLGRPLQALRFIHYARWMIIDGLPQPDGSGWRSLRSKYLLFEAVFDGVLDEYLDAFADVLPVRISRVWSPCFGFDDTVLQGRPAHEVPPAAFRAFVQRNSLRGLDLYVAYAQAEGDFTVAGVRQAITMQERVEPSREYADGTERVLERMPATGQMALTPAPAPSTLRERFDAIYDPWRRALIGDYGVNPLTIATPLRRERAVELAEACKHYSPLAGLARTDTHFARLALMPDRLMDLGQPDPDVLPTPYLLYTSNHDGDAYTHLEQVRAKAAADPIWDRCIDYPGSRDPARFHAWLNAHRLPTQYYVSGYPPRPVSVVADDVQRRRAVAQTYHGNRDPTSAELYDGWTGA